MTAIQKWILDTAKALIGTLRQDSEPDWLPEQRLTPQALEMRETFKADWDLHELRLSIGLVQARALEARSLAALITMGQEALMQRAPLEIRGALSGAIRQIARDLMDRSHNLEKIGMEMTKPGGWPPDETELEVEPVSGMLIQ